MFAFRRFVLSKASSDGREADQALGVVGDAPERGLCLWRVVDPGGEGFPTTMSYHRHDGLHLPALPIGGQISFWARLIQAADKEIFTCRIAPGRAGQSSSLRDAALGRVPESILERATGLFMER